MVEVEGGTEGARDREEMAGIACAVAPVGAQSPGALRYQASSLPSSASSTSAFFSSFKVAASAFVAQQPLGSHFHGRSDSLGAALSSSVAFDNGLSVSRRSRVSKVG